MLRYYYYPIFSDCTVFYWCGGCGGWNSSPMLVLGRLFVLNGGNIAALIFVYLWNFGLKKEAVPKVMSVALIELVEMTATLNVVVSINSTTV
ncbi:MAG: hypothetical protein MR911_00035, partial [Spirochaetia bacterium]|nr:hypothetical protein [Spirochaetia bacterium]